MNDLDYILKFLDEKTKSRLVECINRLNSLKKKYGLDIKFIVDAKENFVGILMDENNIIDTLGSLAISSFNQVFNPRDVQYKKYHEDKWIVIHIIVVRKILKTRKPVIIAMQKALIDAQNKFKKALNIDVRVVIDRAKRECFVLLNKHDSINALLDRIKQATSDLDFVGIYKENSKIIIDLTPS